ncbi:hypothetical protein [Methylorubrum populi]|uniref:Uncharacterized protein n=1 Tax=Methylorubrum populi TaxID=223967 RepID=A0A833J6Z4_9HYPH|nr:hypothetical protein [Methylorubrum populi]KAB7785379.1 hypothetical protein F8B43_1880 [Methylorubrum populi]
MRNPIHIPLTRAKLAEIAGKLGSHMTPVWTAMEAGCVVILQSQNRQPFYPPPRGVGSIVIVEDDTEASTSGPRGFDHRSIQRLARCADSVAVLSLEPVSQAYAEAAATALDGGCALIVETSPQFEIAWLETILTAAPGREILMDPTGPFGRSTR